MPRRRRARRSARKLRNDELNDKEIEIEMQAGSSGMPMFEMPGMPGASMGAISLGDMFGKAFRRAHQIAPHHRLGGL